MSANINQSISSVTTWYRFSLTVTDAKGIRINMEFNKLFKIQVDTNGCFNVINRKPSRGYIVIKINRKTYLAHRLVYALTFGEISKDIVIRHTCDNRKCINPEHLISGTHADNVRDRVKRNRSAIGINHGRTKLTVEQVIQIYKDTISSKRSLAKKFNVHHKAICLIQKGINWKHITKNLYR